MSTSDGHEYDVFILYAKEDTEWAKGVLIYELEKSGVRITTTEDFRPGVPEIDEYGHFIQRSKRTLLVLSPAYQHDKLLDFVDTIAQVHGNETSTWPVIPLILHPTSLEPSLDALTKLDATQRDEWPQVFARLCKTLQIDAPRTQTEKPKCPYPGLRAFEINDSVHFFGRDPEIERLVNKVKQSTVCAVIGPSGCGKSSLVKAGLIPKLANNSLFQNADWECLIIRPGKTPLQTLEKTIGTENPYGDLSLVSNEKKRFLLVVDQLEELFTVDAQEQTAFCEKIKTFASHPYCYVILTLRADFYADLMESRLWSIVQYHKMEIAQLDEEGLREAIRKPAKQAGVYIESALVERLVADAQGGSSILPFLQETMHLLWEKLERRYLSTNAYDSLVLPYKSLYGKGVSGLEIVMSSQADKTISQMTEDQRYIARRIFLQLIHFGEGRAHTRRQEYLSELKAAGDSDEDFETVIRGLSENRLITVDRNSSQETVVDISHEALIRGWGSLNEWISLDIEKEEIKRHILSRAKKWKALGGHRAGLFDKGEYSKYVYKTLKNKKYNHKELPELSLSFLKKCQRTINPGWSLMGLSLIILLTASLLTFSFYTLYRINLDDAPIVARNSLHLFISITLIVVASLSILLYISHAAPLQNLSHVVSKNKLVKFSTLATSCTILFFSGIFAYGDYKDEGFCRNEYGVNLINDLNYLISYNNHNESEINVFIKSLKFHLPYPKSHFLFKVHEKHVKQCEKLFYNRIFIKRTKSKNNHKINLKETIKNNLINGIGNISTKDTGQCSDFHRLAIEYIKSRGLKPEKLSFGGNYQSSSCEIIISSHSEITEIGRNEYKNILIKNSNYTPIVKNLSSHYYKIGEFNDTYSLINQHIKLGHHDSYLYLLLGNIEFLNKNHSKAIYAYNKGMLLDKKSFKFAQNLIMTHLIKSDFGVANSYFNEYINDYYFNPKDTKETHRKSDDINFYVNGFIKILIECKKKINTCTSEINNYSHHLKKTPVDRSLPRFIDRHILSLEIINEKTMKNICNRFFNNYLIMENANA